MGNKLTRKSKPQFRVGILGLDNAGKTTILYQFKLHENVKPDPTVGFNVESVCCGDYVFTIWDIDASHPKTRLLWQHYNKNTRALIYVVDCTDLHHLPKAVDQLHWLMSQPQLTDAVLLVFANKQDLPGAVGVEELVSILQLKSIEHPWAVQACCAINGVGLAEGFEKLSLMLEETKKKENCVKCSGQSKLL